MQYLREPSGLSLRELANELHTDDVAWGGTTNEIRLNLESNSNTLSVAFGGSHEVPATSDGLEQLAGYTGIPRPFFRDLDPDMKQYLLNEKLRRTPNNVALRYTPSGGIHEVYHPSHVRVEPRQVVQAALNVLDETAPVIEWWADSDDLRIDVMVPENFSQGIGGDPAVGDISRGGLRFTQDRKHNLAPAVETYIYRLACTNGMVVPDTSSSRIDARGATVDQVLAELELAAQRAFGEVEEQIAHFYEMRNQPIEGDVTQAVIRVARERGLPTRTAMTLAERVPSDLSAESLDHPPTMFDLVNLITNEANNPRIRSRRSSRAALELAGGAVVGEARHRCGSCHQVVA